MSENKAIVGIIMGSDSDLETMKPASEVLTEFNVEHEIRIISAHRTPEEMSNYAKSAKDRGLKAIIAGAGGAAHLPGMTAAMTSVPVIGVPVPLKHLDGLDSLLSIVQMPKGVPVATVAVGNSANAAYLALRIIANEDSEIAKKLDEFHKSQHDAVIEKDSTL